MFRKIKFFLVSLFIALGVSACSSDDNSSNSLKKEAYDIKVEITDDVFVEQITVLVTNGSKVTTDLLIVEELVAVENGEVLPKKTEWTKTYKKTSKEFINVVVEGVGVDSSSEVTITIKKGGAIIKEISKKGENLTTQLTF